MARRPVDEKIIKLTMDNKDLASKAAESTTLLSRLRDGLNKIPGINLGKTTKELGQLGDGVKGIDMNALAAGVDTVSGRFSNMGVIGMSVLQDLTRRAVDAGLRMGRALINPIVEGGRKRALNIEQAKFQFQGLGMDVEASMESANQAVLGTAFGLDEAAMAAAMFGASGMQAGDEMTSALRAISGVAAMTGSSYSDMANVFTSVAGNGRVMGNDLLRMSSRGLNAAAALGEAMGKTEAEVREMVTKGEIDFETFYKAMDNAFGEHATKASETYSGALSNVRAALGRLGAAVATPAHEALRRAFVAVTPVINSVGVALGPLIERWSELMDLAAGMAENLFDGMDLGSMGPGILSLWTSFENILKAVYAILGPIGEAFFGLIPDSTGSMLGALIKGFEKFTESLIISEEVSEALGRVLNKIAEVIKQVIKVVVGLATSFKSTFSDISGLIEKYSYRIADSFTEIGYKLGDMLMDSPFETIQKLGQQIKIIFRLFQHNFFDVNDNLLTAMFGTIIDYVKLLDISLDSVKGFFQGVADVLGGVLAPAWELVKDIFSGVDFRHFLGGGFLVGVWGIVKKIIENMDGLTGIWKGITDFIDVLKNKTTADKTSILDVISDSITSFSNSLKESVSVGRIVAIAAAIGIMAVALGQVSDLNPKEITQGFMAISGSMASLSIGLKALDGIDLGGVGGLKVVMFATAVRIMSGTLKQVSEINSSSALKGAIGLAAVTGILTTAIAVLGNTGGIETGPLKMIALATAVKILVGTLEDIDAVRVEGLVKGIGTIGLLLAGLAIFANIVDGVKIRMSTALSIAAIAGVMHILVDAIRKIDEIRVEGLVKGIGTIGLLLAGLSTFSNTMNGVKLGPSTALGVLGIAQAMVIMAGAIKQIDDIRVEGLIKGLGTIGIILAQISVFANTTRDTNMISSAIGVGLIAGAIAILVPPLKDLGATRWKDLVKGLGTMAGALGAMAIAGRIASGTLSGALAIAVMALSLDKLIDPIERLSKMPWTDLLSGLAKLAITLGVIAGASMLLSPAVGPMLAFSAAMVGFGAAVALIGAGLALFGTGLTALAGLTATTVAAIIASIEMMIDGVIGLMGKFGELLVTAVETIAGVITGSFDAIAGVVVGLIMTIIEKIDENLEEFIDRGASIVKALMKGIEDHDSDLADQGVATMVSLIDAMAEAIDNNHETMITATTKLIGSVVLVITEVLFELATMIMGDIPGLGPAIGELGEEMTAYIRRTFNMDDEVDEEMDKTNRTVDEKGRVTSSRTGDVGASSTKHFRSNLKLGDEASKSVGEASAAIGRGGNAVSRSSEGAARKGRGGFRTVSWEPAGKGAMDGVQRGIANNSGSRSRLWSTAYNVGQSLLAVFNRSMGVQSPSIYTQQSGKHVMEGLVVGIDSMANRVKSKASEMGSLAINATNRALDSAMSSFDTELRVKVVLDTSDFDNWDPEDFEPRQPDTSFTNRMAEASQPVSHQNEDTLNRSRQELNETRRMNQELISRIDSISNRPTGDTYLQVDGRTFAQIIEPYTQEVGGDSIRLTERGLSQL